MLSRQNKHSPRAFSAYVLQWWHMDCHLVLQFLQMNIASSTDTHGLEPFASGPGHGIRSLVTMRQVSARFCSAVAHILVCIALCRAGRSTCAVWVTAASILAMKPALALSFFLCFFASAVSDLFLLRFSTRIFG